MSVTPLVAAPLALALPLALVVGALAALSVFTGVRGWRGSLDKYGRLGIRSPAASRSDAAFAIANRVAAPIVIGVGGLCAVLTLLLLLAPLIGLSTVSTIVVAAIAVGGAAALLIVAGRMGDAAARAVPNPATRPGSAGGGCGGCGCGSGGCAGRPRTGQAEPSIGQAGAGRTGTG